MQQLAGTPALGGMTESAISRRRQRLKKMKRNLHRAVTLYGTALTSFVCAILSVNLKAEIVAVDGDVTETMDTGGTVDDLAEYIIGESGAFNLSFMSPPRPVWVGVNTSYNALIIQNGSTLSSASGYVGADVMSEHNSATVTGAGSSWMLSQALNIGTNNSAHNTLSILEGGVIQSQNIVTIGDRDSFGNTVKVSGSGSQLTSLTLSMGGSGLNGGVDNSLIVEEGGKVSSSGAVLGGNIHSTNNTITVSGQGSSWTVTSNLYIGATGNEGGGNDLTISDHALVQAGELHFSDAVVNFVRLDGGFLAVEGDVSLSLQAFVIEGYFQVRSSNDLGEEWVVASLADLAFSYYATDQSGLSATGYGHLGGYTVVTAVPEPSTYALIAVGVSVVFWLARRRPCMGKV